MNFLNQIKILAAVCFSGVIATYALAQSSGLENQKPSNLIGPGEPPPPLSQEILDSQPKEIPPDPPDFTDIREKLLLLHQFLSLPHERLVRIRATIEMIESMTEAERESLRVRLSTMQNDAKELEKEMNQYSEGLSLQDRTIANKYWLSQRESQREAFRTKWQQLQDHKKRAAFLKAEIEAFQERQKILIDKLPGS